jgi:hypothetical protein
MFILLRLYSGSFHPEIVLKMPFTGWRDSDMLGKSDFFGPTDLA